MGHKIITGLREAVACARGEHEPARVTSFTENPEVERAMMSLRAAQRALSRARGRGLPPRHLADYEFAVMSALSWLWDVRKRVSGIVCSELSR